MNYQKVHKKKQLLGYFVVSKRSKMMGAQNSIETRNKEKEINLITTLTSMLLYFLCALEKIKHIRSRVQKVNALFKYFRVTLVG